MSDGTNYGALIGGLVDAGLGAYGAYNQGKTASSAADILKQHEQYKYDQAKQNYNAYNAYLAQKQAAQAAGAGAAASAAAARYNAQQKTEKRRRKKFKQAKKEYKENFEQNVIPQLQPFVQTGHRLLPQVEQTYGDSLSGMNALGQFLQSPERMKLMQPSGPTTQQNIGTLPEYLKQNAKGK